VAATVSRTAPVWIDETVARLGQLFFPRGLSGHRSAVSSKRPKCRDGLAEHGRLPVAVPARIGSTRILVKR